jgi:hypothetical protein
MDFKKFRNSIEVSTQGDLVIVSVSMEDPAIATDIANTWTDLAVNAINEAYSAQQHPDEIQEQLTPARDEYLATQAELEEFVQADQTYFLKKQIEETQITIENILKDKTWYTTYLTQRKQNLEQVII